MNDDDSPVPVPSGLDWAAEPSPPRAAGCDVRLTRLGRRKIAVIKVVRGYFGLGLADCKRLVESAPVIVAEGLTRELANEVVNALIDVGASASIDGEEKTPSVGGLATVVLDDHGPRKIAVIKLIREVTGLGLKEAKDLSETPGETILRSVPRERAEHVIERIAAAGGRATIKGEVGSPDSEPAAEQHVSLVLTHTGPHKINIIRIIREVSGLGLKDCKDMSENPPATLGTQLTRPRAERALASIREAGGDGRIDG